MTAIFTELLNMSITASFLIMAVIILRLILKNIPKWIRCLMWGMVAIRLVLPFSFESKLSLVFNAQKITEVSSSSTDYFEAVVKTTETIQQIDVLLILSYIWLAGVVLMLGYIFFSYVHLHRKVRERVHLKENIFICDHIRSPFVLGMFFPKIYLLSSMTKQDAEYVIAHEKAHLKRQDNIWKPMGFILLSFYWFNPLCWIAYFLFNKDIELACDEKVIKNLDLTGKKAYSTALLLCSASRHMVSACPVAFGENNIKQRIKNVLKYQKPTAFVIIPAVILCSVVAVSFMTNPVSASEQKPVEQKSAQTAVSATQAQTVATEKATQPATKKKPKKKTTKSPTEPTKATQSVTQAEQEVTQATFGNNNSQSRGSLVDIQPYEDSDLHKSLVQQNNKIYGDSYMMRSEKNSNKNKYEAIEYSDELDVYNQEMNEYIINQ